MSDIQTTAECGSKCLTFKPCRVGSTRAEREGSWGSGPSNFIKREKNVSSMQVNAQRVSTVTLIPPLGLFCNPVSTPGIISLESVLNKQMVVDAKALFVRALLV